MVQGLHLLGNRRHKRRMGMTHRTGCNTGNTVEIVLALTVPHPATLASHQCQRVATVGRHDMLLKEGGGAHGRIINGDSMLAPGLSCLRISHEQVMTQGAPPEPYSRPRARLLRRYCEG